MLCSRVVIFNPILRVKIFVYMERNVTVADFVRFDVTWLPLLPITEKNDVKKETYPIKLRKEIYPVKFWIRKIKPNLNT